MSSLHSDGAMTKCPSTSPSGDFVSTNSSSSSPSLAETLMVRTADELQNCLPIATRFATADLITSVLRLDFWTDDDPSTIFLCKLSFDILMQHLGMPEKTLKGLKAKLEGESPLNEDLATLITSIKKDEKVKEEGSVLILSSLLLAFVNSGNYDSRYRVLLRHLSTLLGVMWEEFEEVEGTMTHILLGEEYVESDAKQPIEQSKETRSKTARNKKIKRYLMIGAAGGVGGVLIGVTGGLAAPLVAMGATVFGGAIGAAAAGIGTTAGAAILGSALGVAGAGFTGYKMKKRVGAIEEFTIATLTEGPSLSCVLAKPEVAFEHQWRHLRYGSEQYTLHYESKYLVELGCAIDYLMGFAVSMAIQQTLMETALAGLVSAVAWPVALLGAASVLDNPWNVCISRSTEVGEHLAEVLLSRAHGKRPITLIGFSLGARVIFHCLLTLSKRSESAGIIEDVILLGAPVSASAKQWKAISRVVAGRIINGYCETDWLLRFVYRTMSAQITIAGTSPVENKHNRKIVNYNLSHIVKGHMDYSRKLTEVLHAVGIKVSPHSEDSIIDLSAEEAKEEMENVSKLRLGDSDTKKSSIDFTVGEEKVKDFK